jgi:hypothetical protein
MIHDQQNEMPSQHVTIKGVKTFDFYFPDDTEALNTSNGLP